MRCDITNDWVVTRGNATVECYSVVDGVCLILLATVQCLVIVLDAVTCVRVDKFLCVVVSVFL